MKHRTRPLSVLLACASFAGSGVVQAEPSVLDEKQVVRIAVAESPALKAAGLDVESSRWSVAAEDGRLPFTFLTETAYQHASNLRADDTAGAASVSTTETITTYAQIGKRLRSGGELALKVDGSWQQADGGIGVGANVITGGDLDTTLGPYWGLGVRLTATQPLLRGFGEEVGYAALHVAEAQQTSAEIARDRQASELVRDVVTAYWELWYASRSVDIERDALKLAEQQRDRAKGLVDTGSSAPADLFTFETTVATRRESVLNAEVTERQRATTLSQLLGRAPAELRASRTEPRDVATPSEASIRSALARSPDVRDAEASLEVARLQAVAAGDANRPRLDVSGFIDARGLSTDTVSPAAGQVGSLDAVSGRIAVTFELPLDDSQRRAAVAQATLAVKSAEARLEQANLAALATIDNQSRAASGARERIGLVETTVAVAEQQVAAEQARYATGASLAITVAEAQDQLRSARLRLARARVDLMNANLQLQHLSGGLLAQEGLSRAASAGRAGLGPRVSHRATF
jgi:outer membrane protein